MSVNPTLAAAAPSEPPQPLTPSGLKDLGKHLDRLKSKREALEHTDHSGKTSNLISFYTKLMPKATDCERCSIFIHDPEKEKVWLKTGTGLEEHTIEVPKENSVVGKVIATGKPSIEYDLDTSAGAHKLADEITGFRTRSILCVPIKSPSRDEITGAFQLLNKKDGKFTDDDISLAEELAEHLQTEVDSIFLSQEIFGLTEQIFTTAQKAISLLIWLGFSAVVVIVLLFSAWALTPMLAG